MCSMATIVEALAFEVWRDYMTNVIHSAEFNHGDSGNISIIQRIRAKIAHFEDKKSEAEGYHNNIRACIMEVEDEGEYLQ